MRGLSLGRSRADGADQEADLAGGQLGAGEAVEGEADRHRDARGGEAVEEARRDQVAEAEGDDRAGNEAESVAGELAGDRGPTPAGAGDQEDRGKGGRDDEE